MADGQSRRSASLTKDGRDDNPITVHPGPRQAHSGCGEAAVISGGWRGPGWQVFDADPRLGSQVRGWISSAIGGHDCPVAAREKWLADCMRERPHCDPVAISFVLVQRG